MQIVFHVGAHCTDDEALIKCLLKNRQALWGQGIAVPGPARYRTLLREAAAELKGAVASQTTQDMLLDEIIEADGAERVILSFESFMAFPRWAIGRDMLYPAAADRTQGLANLFPAHRCEFHMGIRNPATFLPALLEKQRGKTYEEFIDGCDPLLLRWSELIERIISANPGCGMTVWCDEDTPLIWPEVLREVSGHEPGLALENADEIVAAIMSPEGHARLCDYLKSHPPQTELQRRRIVSAFLDKFALPERIEMELDLPGWTTEHVDAMSTLYDEDVALIARMPGVTFLAP